MSELDELRKVAAHYGYVLVAKERVKHLAVFCKCDPYAANGIKESSAIKNMARAHVITQASREIHAKLIEFDKYLINETYEEPYITLSIELDVIVPKRKGGL